MSVQAPSASGAWVAPGLQSLLDRVGRPVISDAHTHLGRDVDGTACDPEQHVEMLAPVAERAVAFPFHVAGGYAADNDAVLAIAAASGGRVVPFCRVDPNDEPVAEARRALAAGARGIKLHPHSESFTFAHPRIDAILGVAQEAGVPVLVHAGIGIDPLGAPLLRAARSHPGVPIILAHAAISDLAWLPAEIGRMPNVFLDTSWWVPADVLTMFAHIPAGRILFASDAPYFEPALTAFVALRCALAVGLDEDAIACVMGAQLERLLAGEAPVDLGPAPGERRLVRELRLDRAVGVLGMLWALERAGSPMLPAARQLLRAALALPAGDAAAPLAAAALEALELPAPARGPGGVAIAAAILATPGIGV